MLEIIKATVYNMQAARTSELLRAYDPTAYSTTTVHAKQSQSTMVQYWVVDGWKFD